MNTVVSPFKYQELKELLLRDIRAGRLSHREKINSEPELMRLHKVSRNTVRQAMKELENEGYLHRVRGKGTFIRNRHPETSRKIALIIFDAQYTTHPLVARMIHSVDAVLSRHGYALDILAGRRAEPDADINKLTMHYAGFLIGAWQIDENIINTFVRKNIPHLFVKNYFAGMEANAAMINYEKAGSLAVEHLAGLGHTNIALLYAGDTTNISRDFKNGVVADCLDNGIKMRRDHRLDVGFSCEHVNSAVDFLLGAAEPVSAIIAFDDDIAAATIRRLSDKGLKVPGDVSVVGCNNMPIATLFSPALTTVAIPIETLGQKAAEILLGRLDGTLNDFNGLMLEPELIVRASTGSRNPRVSVRNKDRVFTDRERSPSDCG